MSGRHWEHAYASTVYSSQGGTARNVLVNAESDKAERTERYVGKFRRSISLPTQVDSNKVTANYRDGILTVTLPKAEEAKPKQIQVNVA